MADGMESPFTKVFLADPAPLGLAGFAFTTFLLSFSNAGIISASGAVVPLAIAYGGLGQLLAGVFEMRKGNTFGFTAFSSYGGFWLFYALLNLFAGSGMISITNTEVGYSLILWGFFTLYMWLPAMMASVALNLTFLFLWLAFFTLGIGAITGTVLWTHIGGYLGFGTAFFAAYTSFAIVTNSVRPGTLPLGPGIGKKKTA